MPDAPSPGRTSAAVRARYAQALARRAGAHAGEARRVIDERLAALALDDEAAAPTSDEALAALALDGRRSASSQEPTSRIERARPSRGLLAELVAHVALQKPAPVLAPSAKPRDAVTDKSAPSPAPDPKTLQFFKRTWSRLSAEQRLAQSRAALPDNAGPLNSQHLVHRSLTLMHALSPEYLERFVAYIDALQWLEQSNESAEAAVGMKAMVPRKSAALKR